MPGITKKRSLYASDTDGRCLDQLSKAALIDILVEFLRCETDCCDQPLMPADLGENDRIKAVLTARGDRLLPCAAALFAKAMKDQARDAQRAACEAQWMREKEARLARDAAVLAALSTLGR
jgi:hypothetical protein